MTDIAIRTERLSKVYQVTVGRKRYSTLRDGIVEGLGSLLRRRHAPANQSTFWALKDASFEVTRGEVVGIVGRNGAGKSTLLKILSRITEPTTGSAEVSGRVASLLEVGTGFHQELTGRENVFLSGAILGMRAAEISRQFDEIVAFSETDHFIDTPVKHYSTGMKLRLAFAVAAHLEPEILILDEVLAVGDISFQGKCLRKMRDIAQDGRTVLFVSHNMAAMANLCTSGLWLERGSVRGRGPIDEVVSAYIASAAEAHHADPSEWRHHGIGEARFIDAALVDILGDAQATFTIGETLVVRFDVELSRSLRSMTMAVAIRRADTGLSVLDLASTDSGADFTNVAAGKHRFRVEIPECMLYPGLYSISLVAVVPGNILDHVQDVLTFSMVPSDCADRAAPFPPRPGVYHASSTWRETLVTLQVCCVAVI